MPAIQIEGATAAQQKAIRESCERVFAEIPTEHPLRVELGYPAPGTDPKITCATNGERIWISKPALNARGKFYIRFLVYEEAAHFAIEHRGLPQGGFAESVEAFFQELFAGFMQFRMMQKYHPDRFREIRFYAVQPDGSQWYAAGKHVGFGLAGSTRSDELLAEMVADTRFNPALRELAPGMRQELPNNSAEALATQIVGAYEVIVAELAA